MGAFMYMCVPDKNVHYYWRTRFLQNQSRTKVIIFKPGFHMVVNVS